MTRTLPILTVAAACTMALLLPASTARGEDFNRRRLVSAVHELDEAAEHFHRLIHRRTGFSHLASDVHKLADAAEHLHLVVERGASRQHIRNDFARLSYAYQHVRAELNRACHLYYDRHVISDWREVAHAFEDVQIELDHLSAYDRYSRWGGYGHGTRIDVHYGRPSHGYYGHPNPWLGLLGQVLREVK
jgi:hypothetical protein